MSISAAPTTPAEFFTQAEWAQMWKVTTRTVRKHIATGQLRAVRVGGTVRIPASELDRLTGSATSEATP